MLSYLNQYIYIYIQTATSTPISSDSQQKIAAPAKMPSPSEPWKHCLGRHFGGWPGVLVLGGWSPTDKVLTRWGSYMFQYIASAASMHHSVGHVVSWCFKSRTCFTVWCNILFVFSLVTTSQLLTAGLPSCQDRLQKPLGTKWPGWPVTCEVKVIVKWC